MESIPCKALPKVLTNITIHIGYLTKVDKKVKENGMEAGRIIV
jgi:hypothetical protein